MTIRSLNEVEHNICTTQSNIYVHVAEQGYDMKVFSDLYLNSNFCKIEMDTPSSWLQVADVLQCEDFYMPEIGKNMAKLPVETYFNTDVAEWIGYTYRQLYFLTDLSSEQLSKRVPFDGLCRFYMGLHTISEEEAAERILTAYGMQDNYIKDMTEKNKVILKTRFCEP
mgnify:FL=1